MPSPEPTLAVGDADVARRPTALIETTLILVSALAALGFWLLLPGKLARDTDYQAAAKILAAEAKPGDVVLLQPWWTERARLFVPAGLPVVGYLHDEGDDLLEYSHIWVLSEPRLPMAGMSSFERQFLPGRTPYGEARKLGNLTLQRYVNGRARQILFSGAEQVADAHVYLENPDKSRVDCPFDGTAHRCPNGLRVASEWHELFYVPYRCLWMHPPGGPQRLVAEWDDLPGAWEVRVGGGIVWEQAPRKEGVTALNVGADLQGDQHTNVLLRVKPGLEGMQHAQLPGAGGARTKALRVWTQSDSPEGRDACVTVQALGLGAPAP